MKSLLLLRSIPDPTVETALAQAGYKVHALELLADVRDWGPVVSGVVVHASLSQTLEWLQRGQARPSPVYWWPSEPLELPVQVPVGLDGMLYGGMPTPLIAASLQLGGHLHAGRQALREERNELMEKLQERKWIDQAKAILSEIRGLTEAEAYHFLRKEAMKERKKMMDIAQSIVKAYQMIRQPAETGLKDDRSR